MSANARTREKDDEDGKSTGQDLEFAGDEARKIPRQPTLAERIPVPSACHKGTQHRGTGRRCGCTRLPASIESRYAAHAPVRSCMMQLPVANREGLQRSSPNSMTWNGSNNCASRRGEPIHRRNGLRILLLMSDFAIDTSMFSPGTSQGYVSG